MISTAASVASSHDFETSERMVSLTRTSRSQPLVRSVMVALAEPESAPSRARTISLVGHEAGAFQTNSRGAWPRSATTARRLALTLKAHTETHAN